LASPYASNSAYFCGVNSDGSSSASSTASDSFGVCFGLCV
jgi:hypothetical protein